jgi:hypothetical protein
MAARRSKETPRSSASALTPRAASDQASAAEGSERDDRGATVDEISATRLTRLFSRPRPPKQMLAGLRALGFTADAVVKMTEARSRDVVYSWAAGRARPGAKQAERLDDVRRVAYFICRHDELGVDSAWMLFNARFADMDADGPTAMELIARGDAAGVMRNLAQLVDEEGGGDNPPPPDDDPPSDPSSPRTSDEQTVGSGR